MVIQLLDGTSINWKPHLQKHSSAEKRSSYHLVARQLLKDIYPTMQFLEEINIPIQPKLNLYLDFYLPLLRLAVEVQGQQHYKFSPHFHETNRDFIHQKMLDKKKISWCELNDIKLIELPYNEDIEQWKNRIIA